MSVGDTTDAFEDVTALREELERAHSAYERASERVAERGEADLQRVADRHEELTDLFDRYEDEATGDGDFAVFIEFQEAMATFVERLPEDLPHRECFEEVDDLMQQRRLTESDFAAAREALSPVENDVGLLAERDATRSRYEECRKRARRRIRELGDRIAELEDLERLGEADLDAPVERLRDPITEYDEAVEAAFTAFKREESARRVLSFVAETNAFPLVPFEPVPPALMEYVDTHPAGQESIPTLLEYADYSRSKLDHYVDDAAALKQAVATNLTYLRLLSGEPLTVGWPPPSAAHLEWRLRELVQVTGRFADEDVVAQARALRDLVTDDDYDRLRRSAVAREQLDDDQRRRVASGAVAEELAAAREARASLETALADLPD